MARSKAAPAPLGHVHQRYLTPDVATWVMGALSIVWYLGLTIVSQNMLYDSIAALGLMIAFYYGLTGFACTWYYRRTLFTSLKRFLLVGAAPFTGGAILLFVFVRSCIDLGRCRRRLHDVLRDRLAARHRGRVPAARSRPHGHLASGGPPRVLRSPPRGRRARRRRRRTAPALVAGELRAGARRRVGGPPR